MKIIIICLLIFKVLIINAQEINKKIDGQVVDTSLDLHQISLNGLDQDVKQIFQETKSLIEKARSEKDANTEFNATKSWCLLLHNYDFLIAAKECYYKIGLDEKNNAKWPYLYAKASLDNGETEDAIIGFVETLYRDINYLPAHYYLVLSAMQQGNLKTAFQRLNNIPVELMLTSIVLKLSGDLYFEVENYYVAIGYYLQALVLAPDSRNLNYKIARAYQLLGQTELAEEHTEKSNSVGILLIDPYYQEVKQQIVGEIPFLIKAKKAIENSDPQAAIELYQKALEFNPKSESGLINIAVAYYQTNQIEKAKSSFESVLAINPNQTKALFNLATIYMSQQLFESSIDYFQRYMQINSSDKEVLSTLAELYYQTQQYQKTLDLLSAGNDIKTTEIQFIKAKSQIQLENYDQAIEILTAINENDTNNLQVLLALAKIYSQVPNKEVRNPELAFKFANMAFDLNKNVQTYWQLLLVLDESEKCADLEAKMLEFSSLVKAPIEQVKAQLIQNRADELKCSIKP
jgi:tetratricopeptide (TPR) repeat protein